VIVATRHCYASGTAYAFTVRSRGPIDEATLSVFFRGLITALPLGLTIYFFYVFLSWSETLAMQLIRPFIGSFYVPGMGLLLGITGIFLLGFLDVAARAQENCCRWWKLPFTNLPVVKSIYLAQGFCRLFFTPAQPDHPANGGGPQAARAGS